MLKILLTGFEPFGGEQINPSERMLAQAKAPAGCEVIRLLLPVEFRRAAVMLNEALLRERPDIVLSLGQAGGRSAVSLERIAVNLADARIPDNAGEQPREERIVPGAPAAYFSTLPVGKLAEAVNEAGIPAAVSNSAGLYVCNTVFFTAAHAAATVLPGLRFGFLHVPFLPEQAEGKDAPALPLSQDLAALEIILKELCVRQ